MPKMSNINRSQVRLQLTDVRGRGIKDDVDVKFYNQRANSLNQLFPVQFKGRPVLLSNVPAAPNGIAEMFIDPSRYRYKSIFVNVPSGNELDVSETVFVEPDRVKASFPSFTEIKTKSQWVELWRILSASSMDTAASWNKSNDFQKAGLFNIFSKMQHETVNNGNAIAVFIDRVTEFRPARIFARVKGELYSLISSTQTFQSVSGALHKFPNGWKVVDPNGSFKTQDKAGNLQITFAQNAAGQTLVDIDLDDHQGIQHAFDVLKHKITGRDTHPFDIHQILTFFQQLEPGYDLE